MEDCHTAKRLKIEGISVKAGAAAATGTRRAIPCRYACSVMGIVMNKKKDVVLDDESRGANSGVNLKRLRTWTTSFVGQTPKPFVFLRTDPIQTQLIPILTSTWVKKQPKSAPARATQTPGSALDESVGVTFDYIRKGVRLTPWEIVRARRVNTKRLMKEKKLVLILDLDHTLLHSKPMGETTYKEEEYMTSSRIRDIHRLESIATWTKLRPFVHEFLREANDMFDMYVYTMGVRAYALEMARLLDPEDRYFASKVIAREDSRVPNRKGLDVVLAEERVVVILDDTKQVWEENEGNLIVMPKYRFFATSSSSSTRESLSTGLMEMDERLESGGTLATTLSLLKLIHQLFYDPAFSEVSPKDIRELLKEMDRRQRAPTHAITKPTCWASVVKAVHA